MRGGAESTDDYLADWRKGEPQECSDDLQAEAEALRSHIRSRLPIISVRKTLLKMAVLHKSTRNRWSIDGCRKLTDEAMQGDWFRAFIDSQSL